MKSRLNQRFCPRSNSLTDNRRFRWASLMQRRFSECLDRETMERSLETLPDSLEAMYADVLMRQIPKDYREKARLMLMWLAHSIRPLRLRELASLALLPEPMDVCRICTSSLVTLSREVVRSSKRSVETTWDTSSKRDSEEDIIVKFDHFSVKEYMTSERLLASSANPASYFYVSPLLAHLSIAELSVSHLLNTNGSHFTEADVCVERTVEYSYYDEAPEVYEEVHKDKKGDIGVPLWPDFPLLEYSTFWYRHVWEADAIDAKLGPADATQPKPSDLTAEAQSTLCQLENLRTQIHRLFCDAFSQSFKNWVLLLELFTREFPYTPSEAPAPIWLASLLNLPDIVQNLLQSETISGGSMDFVRFSERQPDFERTPIQIAAKNGHLKVLNMLLKTDMRVEQSDLAYMVLGLGRHGGAVLSNILEARPHLTVTERIVEFASRRCNQHEIYRCILDSPGLVNLSKAMFEFIVKNMGWISRPSVFDVGLVETILKRGDDIGYSRGETIEASVQRRNSEFISDRQKAPSISQNVLALMVANEDCGADFLAVALERYKGIHISQDLLALMVANTRCGAEMLALVLRHRKGIHISQELLVAAGSIDDGKIFDLLLDYDENIEVGEDAVKAAAGNSFGGPKIFSAIFSHNKKIEVSEATLEAAARNNLSGEDIISAILNLDEKIEFTEDTLKVVAGNSHGAGIFAAILGYNKNIEVSEDILKVAARNKYEGARIFLAILDHDKNIEVSEDTLIVALTNCWGIEEDIFWAVLSHNKTIEVGDKTLKFAVRNKWKGANMFWALVSLKKKIVISMEVMDALDEDREVGMHILDVLMDHDNCENEVPSDFTSLEEMKSSLPDRNRHFHKCKFGVSWQTVRDGARWEPEAIDFLIAHKRSNVTFARHTTKAISSNSNS